MCTAHLKKKRTKLKNIQSQHDVKPRGEFTVFFLLHKRSGRRQGQDRHLNAQIKFLSSLIQCACVNPRGLHWVPWRQYGFSCFYQL